MYLNRAQLLTRSAKGGAALLLAGSLGGALAGSAAADPLSDGDLAYARLFVGAELLAIDFYSRAVASKRFSGKEVTYLERGLFNEREHYASVAAILTGAGQAAATADDIDFSYSKGSFTSQASIAKLGAALETVLVGAYLGSIDALQANALKQPFARIAASEAQHLSLFSDVAGRDPVGISFPDPLPIEQASDAIDAFTN